LSDVGENGYERFLQYVLRFFLITGITHANGHQPAGILLEKCTLASGVFPDTSFN
jgi:hypothetical protein